MMKRRRSQAVLWSLLLSGVIAACAAASSQSSVVRISGAAGQGVSWQLIASSREMGNSSRLCVNAVIKSAQFGAEGHSAICRSAKAIPFFAGTGLGSGQRAWSVLGFILPVQARAIELRFADRPSLSRNVRHRALHTSQGEALHVGLAGLTIHGHYCLKRYRLYGVRGLIFESKRLGCEN